MDEDTHPADQSALQSKECWELLRSNNLGRLAVVGDLGPDVFPVTYAVDHGTVVFRTAAGSKLTAVLDHPAVAFEADGLTAGTAWSVVIKGRAKEVSGLYDSIDLTRLPLHSQQGGHKDHFVVVEPDSITGRRFELAAPAARESADSSRRAAPE
jgi:uncharacterized protein